MVLNMGAAMNKWFRNFVHKVAAVEQCDGGEGDWCAKLRKMAPFKGLPETTANVGG